MDLLLSLQLFLICCVKMKSFPRCNLWTALLVVKDFCEKLRRAGGVVWVVLARTHHKKSQQCSLLCTLSYNKRTQ